MADPLSVAASVLTVATAAIQTATSLRETVKRYKDRDKTLSRLLDELEDLVNILQNLKEIFDADSAVLELLKRPIDRCNEVCAEFEKAMRAFGGKSRMGLKDWTKMEFMASDINGFIDTIAGYKSTIAIGIGTVTMRTSKLSQQVVEQYQELIEDTAYSLNIHLQRIDEKLSEIVSEGTGSMNVNVDLQDEKEVTKHCLKICEDARLYIDSLHDESPGLREDLSLEAGGFVPSQFQASLLTQQVLRESRTRLAETIARLQSRLDSLGLDESTTREEQKSKLQDDISISRQCLEVCREASDQVSSQKIHTFGEVSAEGESDQVVVTTLADLFDIRKVKANDRAAQLVGSMTDATLQKLSKDRYNSANLRFGPSYMETTGNHRTGKLSPPSFAGRPESGTGKSSRPLANEIRRRKTDGEEG